MTSFWDASKTVLNASGSNITLSGREQNTPAVFLFGSNVSQDDWSKFNLAAKHGPVFIYANEKIKPPSFTEIRHKNLIFGHDGPLSEQSCKDAIMTHLIANVRDVIVKVYEKINAITDNEHESGELLQAITNNEHAMPEWHHLVVSEISWIETSLAALAGEQVSKFDITKQERLAKQSMADFYATLTALNEQLVSRQLRKKPACGSKVLNIPQCNLLNLALHLNTEFAAILTRYLFRYGKKIQAYGQQYEMDMVSFDLMDSEGNAAEYIATISQIVSECQNNQHCDQELNELSTALLSALKQLISFAQERFNWSKKVAS